MRIKIGNPDFKEFLEVFILIVGSAGLFGGLFLFCAALMYDFNPWDVIKGHRTLWVFLGIGLFASSIVIFLKNRETE